MEGKGVLDHVDAVAVHGFPLDWNLWQIDEWPAKLDEIRAVTDLPVWVIGGRHLHLRRRGGAGLGPAAHRRAADRQGARASTGTASTTCRAPGRRRRATARRRARPTTGTSTWACCARTARRSRRSRHSRDYTPEIGLCQWFHFEDHRLDDAVALDEAARRHAICAPACRWADSFRPERARLVRPADGGARGLRRHRDLLLHAGAPRASRRTTPARRRSPEEFAEFCASMIRRYAGSSRPFRPLEREPLPGGGLTEAPEPGPRSLRWRCSPSGAAGVDAPAMAAVVSPTRTTRRSASARSCARIGAAARPCDGRRAAQPRRRAGARLRRRAEAYAAARRRELEAALALAGIGAEALQSRSWTCRTRARPFGPGRAGAAARGRVRRSADRSF